MKTRFKKGQQVDLLVHGAGVVSVETTTIKSISKNAIEDADGRLYNPETLETAVGLAGFWFELRQRNP